MSDVTQISAVGTSLRAHRIKAGLSRTELAHLAKVNQRTVRRIELGQVRRANMSTLRALAAALGITPADLVQAEEVA
ncbi:MAG: helix-turn-helix domain-containing protein [Actinobacteria bacterium]|nr:helix-turn-helix domain-containing protein [Actinomycetota bacterium]